MKNKRDIEKNIRKKKIGLILIILLLIFTVFIYLLTNTTFFHISRVNVNGNKILDDEKVFLASGIVLGENIFKINTGKVKANLESHPYIKEARVHRIMPNKIGLTIKERNELIVIPYLGSYIYMDDEGFVLTILSNKREGSFVEVRGLDFKNITIGKRVVLSDNYELEKVIDFIITCKETKLSQQIEYVDMSNKSNITLALKTGTKVAFGEQNNVKYKLEFVSEILKIREQQNQDLKGIIDFTVGENPVFRVDDY